MENCERGDAQNSFQVETRGYLVGGLASLFSSFPERRIL